MSTKINMATFGQVILVGLILAAVGGYIAYYYSNQDSDKKHDSLVKKTEQTLAGVDEAKKSIIGKQDTAFKEVQKDIQGIGKIVKKKMDKSDKGTTNITINGDKNHVVAGDNNGINGDVYLDKPERKVDDESLQEIIALNKNNKPFEVIYYTNTEECRKFGVAIIEALKAKGFTVTFIARTAMASINYPADPTANAAYEETDSKFIIAIYPLR